MDKSRDTVIEPIETFNGRAVTSLFDFSQIN